MTTIDQTKLQELSASIKLILRLTFQMSYTSGRLLNVFRIIGISMPKILQRCFHDHYQRQGTYWLQGVHSLVG